MAKTASRHAITEAETEVLALIGTDGIRAAADALISTCKDPKATAQAKATAGRTLFEAAGLLRREPVQPDKELHEMTAAELSAFMTQTQDRIRELDEERALQEENNDV